MSNRIYSYGEDDAALIFDKFIDFIMGDESIFVGIIEAYLKDSDHAMKLRNWIFNDVDMIAIAHDWMRVKLGWPIMPNDDKKFWVTRFASFFTPSDQETHIKDMFIDRVVPLLKLARQKS